MNSRSTSRLQFWLMAWVLAFASAGCQRLAAPEPTPTPLPLFSPARGLNTITCPFFVPEDMEITCATIEVPEDYAQVDGRKIELFISIVHSMGEATRGDPIVLLPQFAGVPIIEGLGYVGRPLGDPLEDRDLVFMEYRGQGVSSPELDCPDYITAYDQTWATALNPDQEAAILVEVLKTCRARFINAEIDPANYGVNQIAADLNALRLATGYERFNLLGGRFGAEVAFAMARDYPQSVRSVTLFEFGFPMVYLRSELFAISLQQSLDRLFNACLADDACRQAYPDLKNVFYEVVRQLNASPASLQVFFSGVSGLNTIQVDGFDFLLLVQRMLMDNASLSGIPKLVYEVARGQAINMSDELQRYRFQVFDEWAEGLEISAACAGLHANFFQITPDSRDVQPEILDAFQNYFQVSRLICPIWTGAELPPPATQPIRSDVPILILQGELHPSLSPEVVATLVSEMENVRQVVIPNLSNVVFEEGSCGPALMSEWFENPDIRLDTSCINAAAPIQFILP